LGLEVREGPYGIDEENKQIRKEQKFKLFVRRSEGSDEDDKEAGDEKQ
jgi:hypothetical protein